VFSLTKIYLKIKFLTQQLDIKSRTKWSRYI